MVSTLIKGFEVLLFVAGIFAVNILLLGKHSGAHINPAVTIAHALSRSVLSWVKQTGRLPAKKSR
jgi:glycerol uptake facilitator-like aquaporin